MIENLKGEIWKDVITDKIETAAFNDLTISNCKFDMGIDSELFNTWLAYNKDKYDQRVTVENCEIDLNGTTSVCFSGYNTFNNCYIKIINLHFIYM